jgi:hypothetical protein
LQHYFHYSESLSIERPYLHSPSLLLYTYSMTLLFIHFLPRILFFVICSSCILIFLFSYFSSFFNSHLISPYFDSILVLFFSVRCSEGLSELATLLIGIAQRRGCEDGGAEIVKRASPVRIEDRTIQVVVVNYFHFFACPCSVVFFRLCFSSLLFSFHICVILTPLPLSLYSTSPPPLSPFLHFSPSLLSSS